MYPVGQIMRRVIRPGAAVGQTQEEPQKDHLVLLEEVKKCCYIRNQFPPGGPRRIWRKWMMVRPGHLVRNASSGLVSLSNAKVSGNASTVMSQPGQYIHHYVISHYD